MGLCNSKRFYIDFKESLKNSQNRSAASQLSWADVKTESTYTCRTNFASVSKSTQNQLDAIQHTKGMGRRRVCVYDDRTSSGKIFIFPRAREGGRFGGANGGAGSTNQTVERRSKCHLRLRLRFLCQPKPKPNPSYPPPLDPRFLVDLWNQSEYSESCTVSKIC